jgi:hypothetical protein
VEKNSEKKGDMNEYEKILSGKTEYYAPKNYPEKLEGSIKLQKDPKSENFNLNNVIPKTTVLVYTDWFLYFSFLNFFKCLKRVIGLVLFVGSDCLMFPEMKTKRILCTKLDKKIDFIIIVMSLISLSVTLVI